jgi:hypothetical protein
MDYGTAEVNISEVLPTLHAPINALVLSLYICTGHTKDIRRDECTEKYREQAESIIQCALQVEATEAAIADSNTKDPQHMVWMLVTDSQYLKTWITETYQCQRVATFPLFVLLFSTSPSPAIVSKSSIAWPT